MRTLLVVAICFFIQTAIAAEVTNNSTKPAEDTQLKDKLVSLEQQSWVAWKTHGGSFFSHFLSDDHVEVGFQGITDKKNVVAGVASPACSVESYSISNFTVTRISKDVALLVYHAEQKTTCGGVAVPSPVWASSLYVRRGGRWLNAVYQQSPANK
jgi:hypothetical protein